MIKPGNINTLRVLKILDFGAYLDGGDDEEILMPTRYIPADCKVDDMVDVFVYFDSEDRIVATTETPKARVGECAFLQVVSVNKFGAFLDWGVLKDLFVPFREQTSPMEVGKSYVVFVAYDKQSDRIFASSRFYEFLNNTSHSFEVGQAVNLLLCAKTDLGYKAIINNTHTGVIYANEVFQTLHIGQSITGYIKKLRDDDKIDLCLEKAGYEKVVDVTDTILQKIKQNGGTMNVSDKSSPELIYSTFGLSKKTFKKAIGALYRDRLIEISDSTVSLTHIGKEVAN